MTLLTIKGLVTEFHLKSGTVRAVDKLDLSIGKGEMVGIVGESGCGKSITSFSILGLINPPGRITAGEIVFKERNLLTLSPAEMRTVRGNQISMIFQEPMSSLNPVLTVGRQIAEPLMVHRGMSHHSAMQEARRLLEMVQIPEAKRRIHDYPYQMSGGMRQRVMIAMALSCSPDLLIADEPTTALDVTIQAQILDLLSHLRAETGTAIMLITHDLGVVAETTDRVVVMYAGRKIEEAATAELFSRPSHPYTQALMASMPRLGASVEGGGKRLREIPGIVPLMRGEMEGCAFADRCDHALAGCRTQAPVMRVIDHSTHQVACHRQEELV